MSSYVLVSFHLNWMEGWNRATGASTRCKIELLSEGFSSPACTDIHEPYYCSRHNRARTPYLRVCTDEGDPKGETDFKTWMEMFVCYSAIQVSSLNSALPKKIYQDL
jgi:hypothetical protein